MQLDELYNDGRSLLKGELPQSFVEMHGIVNRSALIDYEAGVAHFDSVNFLQVLEYANKLEQGELFMERPFEEDLRRGNNHISVSLIHSLAQLLYMEAVAGVEITAIGFPTADSVGSIMIPTLLYGMGQGAQNPSGAWEFLRFMLAEQQQRGVAFEAIPVSRSVFDEVSNQLMNPVPLESPELGDGIFIDGVFIEFAPMTNDQTDRLLKIIDTLGVVLSGGESVVTNIVLEEANAFFSGNRSAQDAARIIQNRVSIYVSEQYG